MAMISNDSLPPPPPYVNESIGKNILSHLYIFSSVLTLLLVSFSIWMAQNYKNGMLSCIFEWRLLR